MREPHELLPIIPPIVQRVCVDGSGPNRNACGSAAFCSVAWTVPACTRAVLVAGSSSSTRLRCRLKSSTMPVPIAFPATDVPAPRAVTGTLRDRATSSVASTSSSERGRTITCGTTR